MYCPKCSQQQLSEAVRFCSRCGFPLDGVTQLVAHDGVLPARLTESARLTELQSREPSPRRKGIQTGAKIALAGFALIPAGYGLCFILDTGAPVMIPITVFLIGLAWMFYHRVFGDTVAPLVSASDKSYLDAPAHNFALSAAQSLPLTAQSLRPANTSEMAQPSSVTEQTTRLLDSD